MNMGSKFWVIKINIFFLLLLSILINGQDKNLSISDINLILGKKEFYINLKRNKENNYYKVYTDNSLITEVEIPREKFKQLEINKSIITTGKIKFYSIDKNIGIVLEVNQALSLSKVKKNYIEFQFYIDDEKLIANEKLLYFKDNKQIKANIIWFNRVPKNIKKHTYIDILTNPNIEFNIDEINYFTIPINELLNLINDKYSIK